jgi:hypothetical protein
MMQSRLSLDRLKAEIGHVEKYMSARYVAPASVEFRLPSGQPFELSYHRASNRADGWGLYVCHDGSESRLCDATIAHMIAAVREVPTLLAKLESGDAELAKRIDDAFTMLRNIRSTLLPE